MVYIYIYIYIYKTENDKTFLKILMRQTKMLKLRTHFYKKVAIFLYIKKLVQAECLKDTLSKDFIIH